jgi:hypothetical protein
MPQLLIWAGLVGGPLFVVVFLLEGATRTGYDPLRQPVSALALGPGGWMQQANFIVTGVLMLAFAVGLGTGLRTIGGPPLAPALIGLYAVGLIGAGVFVTGPVARSPRDGRGAAGMPALGEPGPRAGRWRGPCSACWSGSGDVGWRRARPARA